ncbi:hypothetical protein IW147_004020 [Coemansia sp. RSA 720]|nr:hypothetical protein IW147_004020 [Coemansia sp. RSA 720]
MQTATMTEPVDTDDIAQVLMNISYTQELREITIRETRHIREQSPSCTNLAEDIARVVSTNILLMQDSLDIEYTRKNVQLLLRPAITLNAHVFPRISEFLDRPVETTGHYDPMLVNIESKAEAKDVSESVGVAKNTSNVLLITGCAGSGKTHVLQELAVRALWKTENVRLVYIHDFQTWALDSDAEAILYFVEKVKSAFIQDVDFNDTLQLGVHIGTTAGSICSQVLMAVKAYCLERAKANVPLKVVFCIDNYCQAKSSSLASKFMQMVCDYTSTMFVVAAVFDARVVGTNRPVKLPHAYHRTEAAAVITDVLIHQCTHNIVRIWRVDQPRLLTIVQRYTMFNPLEVTELFRYAKSARCIDDFVQLASEFICVFQSALPNLGFVHDFGFARNPDRDIVDYINSSAKKTLLQAFFHLQAKTPSHFKSQNFSDTAMMDYHPCIRFNVQGDGCSSLQFSSPRVANYMLYCTFGGKCPLVEMSELLGTSDQDRYDMAYAATQRLAQTPGTNIADTMGPTTVHRLVEAEAHAMYSEIRALKRADLDPQAVALVVQSEACGVRELSRTWGLDFGSRSATGETDMAYIIAVMVSSDSDMRAIMQALSTNSIEAIQNTGLMSPMKRVLMGVNEALKLRNVQRESRKMEVFLLGTSSTVNNMNRCEIKDPSGRFIIKLLDITDVKCLEVLDISQFL